MFGNEVRAGMTVRGEIQSSLAPRVNQILRINKNNKEVKADEGSQRDALGIPRGDAKSFFIPFRDFSTFPSFIRFLFTTRTETKAEKLIASPERDGDAGKIHFERRRVGEEEDEDNFRLLFRICRV